MSGGVIFSVDSEDQLHPLEETPFDAEARLQELVALHPGLLAGDQIEPAAPRRWLLVAREIGVPDAEDGADRWSMDHLFLDQEAIPTFVEVKRSSDTRIRREVVGQMLDYAANALAYWPTSRLEADFRERRLAAGQDPDNDLRDFLGGDTTPEEFWDQANVNLQLGRLRLLFVADQIPDELRRIVEFLNDQMERTQVLAVEIRQFAGEGLLTLVPRLIGNTERARAKSAPSARLDRPWERASFLARLEELGSPDIDAAVRVLDWGEAHSLTLSGGRGPKMASLFLTSGGEAILGLDEWNGSCRVRTDFRYLPAPFDTESGRDEALSRLNVLSAIDIPRETQYRGIPLSQVSAAGELGDLFTVFDWMLERIIDASS